jgi:peptide-methionine (R)-S-oxide reductase
MKRLGAALAIVAGLANIPFSRAARAAESFEIVRSDEAWRKQLGAERYRVLRLQGTEYPGTSPLLNEHRRGIFACGGCDLALFSSETKFESGTGWPSFWAPLLNAVRETRGGNALETWSEVHCRRCGGHLGHVFADGPKPTGLRYCMNGVALTFHPGTIAS